MWMETELALKTLSIQFFYRISKIFTDYCIRCQAKPRVEGVKRGSCRKGLTGS